MGILRHSLQDMSKLSLPELLQVPKRTPLWVPGSWPREQQAGLTRRGFGRRRCYCDRECWACSGSMPEEYQIAVSGFTAGTPGFCDGWAAFNDIFIAGTDDLYAGRETCSNRHVFSPEICTTYYAEVWFRGGNAISGGIYGNGSIYYQKNHGSIPPCEVENYELLTTGYSGLWGDPAVGYSFANSTASKMVITAL